MAVEIHYCPVWSGYDRRAASLAATLEAQGITASAVEGEHSQFDVLRDGELVFSKQREGRFPEEDEVLGLLRWAASTRRSRKQHSTSSTCTRAGLFAFYDVGDGTEFCLDTTRINGNGEMPVVAIHGGLDAREEIAADFGSAFLMLVEEELALDDE